MQDGPYPIPKDTIVHVSIYAMRGGGKLLRPSGLKGGLETRLGVIEAAAWPILPLVQDHVGVLP